MNITVNFTGGVHFHVFADPTNMRVNLFDVNKTVRAQIFLNMSSLSHLGKSVYGRIIFTIVNVGLQIVTSQNIDPMNVIYQSFIKS